MSRLSDAEIAEKRESVTRRDSDYMDVSDLLADREAILAELKLAEELCVKFHDDWLKTQAELAACRAELAEANDKLEQRAAMIRELTT